jgi:hypothetical protein
MRYEIHPVKNIFEAALSSDRDPNNHSIIIDLQHTILREEKMGAKIVVLRISLFRPEGCLLSI